MKFRFILLLVVICFFQKTFGQDSNEKKVDSLLNLIKQAKTDTVKARHYLEIAQRYRLSDPTQNNAYTEKAKKIYLNHKDTIGIASAYSNKYAYFFTIGQLDSANYYLDKSITLYLSAKDTLSAAKLQYNLAYQAITSGKPTEAEEIISEVTPIYLKYYDSISLGRTYMLSGIIAGTRGYGNIALNEYFKSLKIYRAKNEKNRIAEALFAIANEYLQTKQYQKAIGFFEENITLSKEVNIQFYVAQSLNYIGRCYTQLENLDKAENNLKQALKLSEQLNFQYNIGKTYLHLGELETKKNNYAEAKRFLDRAKEIFKSMKIPNDESIAWVYLGLVEIENGNYGAAIQSLDKSLAMGKNIDDTDVIRDALYYKSLAFEGKGDIKNALATYKESKVLSDSIFNLENSKKTKELQIMFETERKEQQLALQDKEITVLEQEAKISTQQKLLLGGGLGLSLIALGFGFYGFRQRTKRNELAKEKVEAELAFKKKELTTHALHLAKKNEVLESVKLKAKALKEKEGASGYQELIKTINFDQQDDKNWESFTQYFEQVHKDFASNVKNRYPEVTKNELRFMALLKMNLSSKEIATILNISTDGIKKARQRLRKKLGLSPHDSLESTVLGI